MVDRLVDTPAARERLSGMRQHFIEQKRQTHDELLDSQRAEHPGWSDAELEPWADAKQRFSPNVLSVLDQDNVAGVDWSGILGRITCPALLIIADPELGAIVTDESAAALKALVPHLEIAHVPEAGHSVRRDQFARYMEVISAFLSESRAERDVVSGRSGCLPWRTLDMSRRR